MNDSNSSKTSTAPEWVDGIPANLEAAAADALEWLLLVERCVDRGVWSFSQPDSRNKLRCARMSLQQMLNGPDAGTTWSK
jgi:hypothetical protein